MLHYKLQFRIFESTTDSGAKYASLGENEVSSDSVFDANA